MPSNSLEQLHFKWKKLSPENQKRVYKEADNIGNEFPYSKVCIEKELSGDQSPNAVIEKVTKFTSFITDIVIPQTALYTNKMAMFSLLI